MSWGDYLGGVAFFAGTWGAVGTASWLVVHRRLRHLRGVEAALAGGLVFTAGLIVAHLLPLALGVLTRGTALAAAGLLLAGAWLVVPGGRREAGEEPAEAAPWGARASWALAALGAGALTLWTVAYLKEHVTTSVLAVDYTSFHMPGVARWIQTGSVWHDYELVPRFSLGTYPGNGDVVFLAATLPWRNDAFVRLVNYPYLALVGLSVYALALRLRAPRPTAVLFAAVVVAMPAIMEQAVDRVKPDAMTLACFGAGAVFLVRHCSNRRGSDLALAGLGLGLAFGARWNAAGAVLVVLVAWALATWRGGRSLGRVARDGGALVGAALAAGGFWLVRNWVTTGNPVYPAKVAPLGLTIFDAPRDVIRERYGFSIADYLTDGHVLGHTILPGWRAGFAGPGILLLAALLLALALSVRPRARAGGGRRLPWPPRAVLLGLAGAGLGILVGYVLTPASAQGFRRHPWPGLIEEASRWSAPAAVLAGGLAAWAARRLGRWRLALEVLALAAIGDGIHRSLHVSRFDLGIAAGLLAGAAAAVLAVRLLLPRLRSDRRALAAAGTGAVVAAAAVVLAGYHGQRRYNDRRYLGVEPTFDWLAVHAPAGHRVAIAGEFATGLVSPNYPPFGPRLRNRVAYVGPRLGHTLQEYGSAGPFQAALRRGRYDLVLVGRGLLPHDGTAAERWTLAAGYVPVARSYFDVLLVRP